MICSRCGEKIGRNLICSCGFDCSRDYERFPTLTTLAYDDRMFLQEEEETFLGDDEEVFFEEAEEKPKKEKMEAPRPDLSSDDDVLRYYRELRRSREIKCGSDSAMAPALQDRPSDPPCAANKEAPGAVPAVPVSRPAAPSDPKKVWNVTIRRGQCTARIEGPADTPDKKKRNSFQDWVEQFTGCTDAMNPEGHPKLQYVGFRSGNAAGLRLDGCVVLAGKAKCNWRAALGWRDIVQIAAGPDHLVGLHQDGTVEAVGEDVCGRCEVSGWRDIIQVAAGEKHTLGLRADGTVIAVGSDDCSQCSKVKRWREIIQLAAADSYSAGLCRSGKTVMAGMPKEGRFTNPRRVFNPNLAGSDYVQLTAGVNLLVGLNRKGMLRYTGSEGALMFLGYISSKRNLQTMDTWQNVLQVAGSGEHTVALFCNGHVAAYGADYHGECDITEWADIVCVAAGYGLTLGLRRDGTLLAAGKIDGNHAAVRQLIDELQA